MAAHYLAFDLGASSGRAVLGRLQGERFSILEIHRFANGPANILGRLHWNAAGILEHIKAGLTLAARSAGTLDGIGIDTWGVDYGLLSAEGRLLGLPCHYRDARTDGMMQEAFRNVPREQIYARTGIQFMQLNTLFQLMAEARQAPAALAAARTLLFMPDLFNYWLTGERVSELTIASTSQLMDVRARVEVKPRPASDGLECGARKAGAACATEAVWAVDLMQALGLPVQIMPGVVPPGTRIGPLHVAVREETGLAAAPVIATASHDTASAVAAVPARGNGGWAYISLGTWSLVGVERESPIHTPEALACNMTNERGVGGAVRFLRNVAGLWLVQECMRTWEREDPRIGENAKVEQLTAAAAAARPLASLIDPDDARFAAPGDTPGRIRDYCRRTGQPVPKGPADIIRCVLDSLAVRHAAVIESLERLTGERIERIHVVGGGVRNALLCQLTADAASKPVIAGPVEATAIGNCLVQAMAEGRIASLAELRELVARSFELREHEPQARLDWAEAKSRIAGLSY